MMDEAFKIVPSDEPEWGIIGGGIREFNVQQTGDGRHERFCYVLRDSGQEIVGGVIAEIYWEWLYLDLLWVREDLRGRGFGRQLLIVAEDEARKKGAKNVFLDTFSFQAPKFYERHGYEVFGELEEFPPGHRRYYFRKRL